MDTKNDGLKNVFPFKYVFFLVSMFDFVGCNLVNKTFTLPTCQRFVGDNPIGM